jgi:short-subunit dehydrogenase
MIEMSEAKRYALVTGASSGIGHEFARLLAADGIHPILTARNEARLEEVRSELESTYGVEAKVIARDLSDPAAPDEVFSFLAEEGITIDVLINNAGFNVHGEFIDSDLEQELTMIRLHVSAVTHLTKLFLRQLPEGQGGMILNVSSVAAFVPGPYVSVHFATRAHTLSFSEALSLELKKRGVRVTCLCPGPVTSEFFDRAGMNRVRLASGCPLTLMSARAVAEAGYKALKRGKRIVIPGFRNKLVVLFARHLPLALLTRITRWLMASQ